MLAATSASAAESIGAGYTSSPLVDLAGKSFGCGEVWSGGSDAQGYSYIPCRKQILKLDMFGRPVQSIPTPAGLPAFRDVAPNAAGDQIFFVAGIGDKDNPIPATQPGQGSVVKLVRGADGNWSHDTGFSSGPYALGARYWAARNVAVDLAGAVYVTTNQFVFILDPKTGARTGAFGGDMKSDAANRYIGGLDVAQGLAISADGSKVYVVEQNFDNVTRWDRVANGNWTRVEAWRLGTPNAVADCVNPNVFASPYDVALDGAGGIYVVDTTCRRILKFDVDSRAYVGAVWSNYAPPGNLYHGIAVDFAGNVVNTQQERRYKAPVPLTATCRPDSDIPTVRFDSVPATGYQNKLTIKIDAKDGCSKIAKMRLTGPVVGHNDWVAAPADGLIPVELTGGEGIKNFTIEVQDTYGRTSGVATATTDYSLSYWVPVAKKGVAIYGVRRLCKGNPLTAVQGARNYAVVSRCATFTGTVESTYRRGRLTYAYVRLPLSTTRAIYGKDAPRAVSIWIIGASSNATARKIKKGRMLKVTSAVITDKKTRKSVTAIPVYKWQPR